MNEYHRTLFICGTGTRGFEPLRLLRPIQLATGPLQPLGYVPTLWRFFQQLTAIITLPLAGRRIIFITRHLMLLVYKISYIVYSYTSSAFGTIYTGCLDLSAS